MFSLQGVGGYIGGCIGGCIGGVSRIRKEREIEIKGWYE